MIINSLSKEISIKLMRETRSSQKDKITIPAPRDGDDGEEEEEELAEA